MASECGPTHPPGQSRTKSLGLGLEKVWLWPWPWTPLALTWSHLDASWIKVKVKVKAWKGISFIEARKIVMSMVKLHPLQEVSSWPLYFVQVVARSATTTWSVQSVIYFDLDLIVDLELWSSRNLAGSKDSLCRKLHEYIIKSISFSI